MRKFFKKLLIPSKENEYKPDVLQRISAGIILILVLITFTVANVQALLWSGSEWLVSTILPSVIVEMTNDERSDNALRTVRRNTTLDRAATLKAEHMAEREYFAHYSPDGTSPWYWFDEVGYDFVHAGENLAIHFTDSGEVIDAWMASPGHRANILNGRYTEIGVGTARGSYNGYSTVYVVQLFGTPAATELASTEAPQVQSASADTDEENADQTSVEVATGPGTDDDTAPAAFETVETEPEPEPVELTEEGTLEDPDGTDVVTVYSDLATTSRDAVPATTTPAASTDGGEGVSVIARTATAPSMWLQIVYGALALFVVVALVLSIVIEWRRQHPVQIAYGGGLLAVMALLFYIHTAITSGAMII